MASRESKLTRRNKSLLPSNRLASGVKYLAFADVMPSSDQMPGEFECFVNTVTPSSRLLPLR